MLLSSLVYAVSLNSFHFSLKIAECLWDFLLDISRHFDPPSTSLLLWQKSIQMQLCWKLTLSHSNLFAANFFFNETVCHKKMNVALSVCETTRSISIILERLGQCPIVFWKFRTLSYCFWKVQDIVLYSPRWIWSPGKVNLSVYFDR